MLDTANVLHWVPKGYGRYLSMGRDVRYRSTKYTIVADGFPRHKVMQDSVDKPRIFGLEIGCRQRDPASVAPRSKQQNLESTCQSVGRYPRGREG